MKASDNVFPKVDFAEGAAPATPPAGEVRIYAKADGLMYSKDDAGAETQLGGGGGTVPTGTGFTHITAGVQDGAAKLVDTADVNDAQITYPKIQDISVTSRALGRNTAGAGDVEEVTLTQILDWIGSTAQGDILFRGAASWARLAAGTSGNVLTTQGAAADPIWAAAAGGGGAMTLIGTATVAGAAATTLTLSGLDLSAYKAFEIFMSLDNATASSSSISIYFNADTTATNYNYERLFNSSTTNSALRDNNSIFVTLPNNDPAIGKFTIINDQDGRPRVICHNNSAASASIDQRLVSIAWVTAANLTSITLSASVASSLAIGSTFSVFGVN